MGNSFRCIGETCNEGARWILCDEPGDEQSAEEHCYSELAEVEGVLRYPTTVVLNSDFTQNKRIVGFLNNRDFRYWLQFSKD